MLSTRKHKSPKFRREEPPDIRNIVASNGVIYAKGEAPGEEVRLYASLSGW